MRKLTSLLIVAISCIGFVAVLPAQEKNSASAVFTASKEVKTKLRAGQTVAVFLNGNDVLSTRILEDTLGIYLANTGFNVVNRERLEKTVGEQIDKKRMDKVEKAINALDIGKVVNAEWIVTGTVIIEPDEQKSLTLKIGSFQLIDVAGEKTLINAVFEPVKGKSLSDTAKEFADILRQNM